MNIIYNLKFIFYKNILIMNKGIFNNLLYYFYNNIYYEF